MNDINHLLVSSTEQFSNTFPNFSYCSLTQWPVADGKSMQQTVDFLTKKAEFMGAVKTGTFTVDCDTFYAAGNRT